MKERNESNIVPRTPYWVKWHINPTKAKQINQCFLSLAHYLTSGWLIFVLTTNRLLRHCHPFFTFVPLHMRNSTYHKSSFTTLSPIPYIRPLHMRNATHRKSSFKTLSSILYILPIRMRNCNSTNHKSSLTTPSPILYIRHLHMRNYLNHKSSFTTMSPILYNCHLHMRNLLTTNRLWRHCHPIFTFVVYTCVIH